MSPNLGEFWVRPLTFLIFFGAQNKKVHRANWWRGRVGGFFTSALSVLSDLGGKAARGGEVNGRNCEHAKDERRADASQKKKREHDIPLCTHASHAMLSMTEWICRTCLGIALCA